MERFDVGQDDRFDAVLAAVDRGEEVVLVRDGRDVAQVVAATARKGPLDLDKLAAVQRAMMPLRIAGESGAALVRRMRDEAEH